MNKFIVIILSVFIFGLSAVFAQGVDKKCGIEAWVEDKEMTKDIFIHETPSPLGKVIGEIPLVTEDGEETIVEIIGYVKGQYTNGWLKIRKAVTIEDKVIFEGVGWIPVQRVTVNVQRPDGNSNKSAPLFAQPKLSSQKIGTIPSETLVKIVGYDCFGLKVKYKGKTGWISKNNICGNPVTTCS